MIRDVTLELVRNCNLKCGFCFIPHELKRNDNVMSWDVIRSSLDFAEKAKVFAVILGGGEPFLHPRLMDAVVEARRKLFATYVTTNLTIPISEEELDLLRRVGAVMKFTIYGFSFEQFHRVTGGSEVSWRNFVTNIEKLLEHGIKAHIMIMPDEGNGWLLGLRKEELSETFQRALERYPTTVIMSRFPDWFGRIASEPPWKDGGSRPDLMNEDPLVYDNILSVPSVKANCIISHFPRVYVTYDGTVYPCPGSPEVLGHISKIAPELIKEKICKGLPWYGGRCSILFSYVF